MSGSAWSHSSPSGRIRIFTPDRSFQSLVKKDDGSYELVIPRFSPTATQAITWVKPDVGNSVLALFKNYDRAGIQGQTFHAVTAQMNFTELAELISKGLAPIMRACTYLT